MPYIKQENRKKFEEGIKILSKEIETSGDFNYVITKLMHDQVKKKGLCYETLNNLIGALTCASIEFSRRVVAPYEDLKIKENGDV